MGWVLDCSLALAWALPDEMSRRADRFLAHVARTSRFWVPALWWYELSNALLLAQRRHRLGETDRIRVLARASCHEDLSGCARGASRA